MRIPTELLLVACFPEERQINAHLLWSMRIHFVVVILPVHKITLFLNKKLFQNNVIFLILCFTL